MSHFHIIDWCLILLWVMFLLINRFVTLAILHIILVKSKSNRNVHRVPTCEIRGSIKILQEFELSLQNTFLYNIAFYKTFIPWNRSNETNYFIACVMNCLHLFHVKFDFLIIWDQSFNSRQFMIDFIYIENHSIWWLMCHYNELMNDINSHSFTSS